MSITQKVDALAEKALDYRATRQKLIIGNIANVDTPFYRPRDISFNKMLQAEAEKIFKKSKKNNFILKEPSQGKYFASAMEKTSDKTDLFYRDGHLARNDGNSVDLDIETTELTKNMMMFQAIVTGMKAKGKVMKAVIEASKQTN